MRDLMRLNPLMARFDRPRDGAFVCPGTLRACGGNGANGMAGGRRMRLKGLIGGTELSHDQHQS